MHSPTASVAKERFVPVTLALGLGTFLVLFDVTAVVVIKPVVVRDLGFTIAGAAWIIDAYSLAFAGALLASGALADRFGRRRAMLSGNTVFLIASIACGMATTGPMLLASRAVQSVGAAFMVTGAIALVAGAFPNQSQRTRRLASSG
jgi:MFS family permease